jgi:hypothetical protein
MMVLEFVQKFFEFLRGYLAKHANISKLKLKGKRLMVYLSNTQLA